ncbi:hypothetical protein C5167_043022 [Papaver somniferum]|uniref:Allyl alcohol dehydrogenase-like protein n=1 Tax=Papaver somniferum TaxID=3469 RepID=A0A4Y7L4I7_PAPSO|nr:uncharacterized protein LOC113319113 [Papaver somniferum]RZC80454.1 hypothetical protein C5167_043022 [Papaver somniferum]
MGILSWLTGKEAAPVTQTKESGDVKPVEKISEISEMNGAMEVPRPADVTVFEFGSAAVSADKVTLAGYCTVSEELEPCRWEILPGTTSEAPQFRVVF